MSNEANAVTAVPPNRVKRLQNAIRSIRRASIATRYAGRIRNAYRKEYEDHHKRKIRELVNGYRSDGLPVPFLSVCDRGTQEIRFTKLLRHFLDPSEPHGLGSRLLEAGFGDLVREARGYSIDWAKVHVWAEVVLGETVTLNGKPQGNRLDILVVVRDVAILLEQKILSAEDVVFQAQDGREPQQAIEGVDTQLKRYSDAFESSRGRLAPGANYVIKVFLTPAGWSAKDTGGGWRSMSHGELISRFMKIDQSGLAPVARHNLFMLLWDLACGPLELTEYLRAVVPVLEHMDEEAEMGEFGPYLNWRRETDDELFLFMQMLDFLQEGAWARS
jgi:hypothetical protein